MTAPGAKKIKPNARRNSVPAAVLFVLIPFVVGGLGSLSTAGNVDGWYKDADKAFWTPPNWVFAPVWSFLYLSMGIAAWLIWREADSRWRTISLRLFVSQLVLNAIWTPIFFSGYPLWGSSAFWQGAAIISFMDIVVLLTMIAFSLLLPYWSWLLYATTLNIYLALNN